MCHMPIGGAESALMELSSATYQGLCSLATCIILPHHPVVGTVIFQRRGRALVAGGVSQLGSDPGGMENKGAPSRAHLHTPQAHPHSKN